MPLSEKVKKRVQVMDEWYEGLDVQAKRIDPNATIDTLLGPPTYNQKDLMALTGKGVNLNIIHKGLQDIAPDLNDQSSFVLNSLKDGMDSLRTDIYELYEHFESFTRETGPWTNISGMDQKSRNKMFSAMREDYHELLTLISMNAVSVYTSQGLIQNAISMLQMQATISAKVIEFGGKMDKRRNYTMLATSLKAILKQIQTLQALLQELQLEVRKVKDPPGKNYPSMETSGGKQRVDKLYYDVLIKFLRVVRQCHKVQASMLVIESGLRKIARVSEAQLGFKPSEVGRAGDIGTFRLVAPKMSNLYGHINSKADYLDAYNKLDRKEFAHTKMAELLGEDIAKQTEAQLDERTKRASVAYVGNMATLMNYNRELTKSLEEVF